MNARLLGCFTARTAQLGAAMVGCMLFAITANAAPADDIRDIRGPKPVASAWTVWALVGGGVILALSAYALWRWIKRRRKAPEKSDLEVALDRLEAARTLMQPGRARDFSIEEGELTATMKVRRTRAMENFKEHIAELYAGRE